tara:strand:- start:201 stop:929 length:729 start_codon:yes stop_codon:yes gene_type:complete
MAKDLINIGTDPNDNTGDPIRDAFNKANLMFTELYDDDLADVSSIEATAPIARDSATGIVTISLTDGGISTGKIANDAVTEDKLANAINSAIADNTAKIGITTQQAADIVTNNNKETNATHTGEVTGSAGSAALTIANDIISYAKLGAEFTTVEAMPALELDFADAQVFTKTISGTSAFTFVNQDVGMVKDLVLQGGGAETLTWPTGTKIITGTYDGSVLNLIQIVVVGAASYWVTISKPAT